MDDKQVFLHPENKERIDDLGGGIKIFVSKNYSYTMDSFLLAAYAKPSRRESVLELGCGSGAVTLSWYRYGHGPRYVQAVDVQKGACELLKKSIVANELTKFIEVCNKDFRELKGDVLPESFDRVVCNPPYHSLNSSKAAGSDEKDRARRERTGTFQDIAKCAVTYLKFGGKFIFCHRPYRLAEVLTILRSYRMEPKRLQFVQAKKNTEAYLFLIEAKKGAASGLRVLPALVLEDKNDECFRELDRIYDSGVGV